MRQILYNKTLAKEWIDWVESPNMQGTREQEIFPFIKNWLKKIKPKVLGDIGCGQGSCSQAVGNKTIYIGIDPSPTLIERAKIYIHLGTKNSLKETLTKSLKKRFD